ncbi:protein kinase domain-containing protein [Marinibactrum halimedae]|uniref:Protein kinase domain-containing protein n=1 Tax=Marinibactrum halimedae TaxID=1444977 RepID=A0AA37T7P3_9GAMM|nr:serine/threonine-protein kinase [Marinibactrum halimedae]MCD9460559.1 protein kinase [Marinibactrum halimedae]GLS27189.1 hypothetical protein GCM10007877_29080 [Marinibactrum halimedae]
MEVDNNKTALSVSLGSRYTIGDVIGEGGYGRVYQAYDNRLARQVAIKVILKQQEDSLSEAQRLASCKSQYIVDVYDVVVDEYFVAIIMELVIPGTPLDELPLTDIPLQRFLRIFYQLLLGVKTIHANGFLHLDLKPNNILLTQAGDIKISDFGIARALGKVGAVLRDSSFSIKGSWCCITPEQLGGKEVSEATDIFALGIILFTYLNKRHPFLVADDRSRSKENILHGRLIEFDLPHTDNQEAVLAASFEALNALAVSMLSKNTKNRPSIHKTLKLITVFIDQFQERWSDNSFTHQTLTRTEVISPFPFTDKYKRPLIYSVASSFFIMACVFAAVFFWPKTILRTLVIPTLKIESTELNGDLALKFHDDNLVVATIIEDELEAAVIKDPGRRLISKKEWSGDQDWRREAERLNADEVVVSEVSCKKEFCNLNAYIYQYDIDNKVNYTSYTIPHHDLLVLTNIVEYVSVNRLGLHSSDRNTFFITDENLRRYHYYRKRSEGHDISEKEIEEIEWFSGENPDFLAAQLLLIEVYLSQYNPTYPVNRQWLHKAMAVVHRVEKQFPNEPSVERVKFKISLAKKDMASAEKSLSRLQGVAGIDVNQLVLDKLRMVFDVDDPERAYKSLLDYKKLRATNNYYRLRARMELLLEYHDKLLETSKEWVGKYPGNISKYYLATAYLYVGNLSGAIEVYEELSKGKFDYDVHVNKAVAHFLNGAYEKSFAVSQFVLENTEGAAADFLNCGESLRALGSSEADVYFQKVLNYCKMMGCGDIDLAYKALALAHLGEKDKALIALQEAAQSDLYKQTFHLYAYYVYSLLDEEAAALFNGNQALQHGIKSHWLNLPWTEKILKKLSM